MKKYLAIVLSCVLVLTLVAFAACNDGTNAGGNNFKEVDLTNEQTREEFVNVLAEKVSIDGLFGNPSEEGWTYGLEQSSKSVLKFDITHTEDENGYTLPFTAKADVQLNENAKILLTGKGSDAMPDLAASLSLSAKGKVDLDDNFYLTLYNNIPLENESDIDVIKSWIADFNYGVDAYADNEGALVSISDGLYGKLPQSITDKLGSNKIKIPFGAPNSPSTYDAAPNLGADDYVGLDVEEVKQLLDAYIVNFIIPFKVSVAVSTVNGYALRITVTQETILAICGDATPSVDDNPDVYWTNLAKEIVAKSITSDSKFELTLRLDKNGAFSYFSEKVNLKLNLNYDYFDQGNFSGTISLNNSIELKKFSGKITKPNDADYKALPSAD